jgi:hypothetical protein
MSNEIMTVGSIRTTANPPSGIYEALLEKAERERDEALKRVKDCGSHMIQVCEELEAGEGMIAVDAAIMVMGKLKRSEKENEEQARLLGKGSEREARLITERDHWKRMYEEADWKTVEAETYKKELMETRKDRNKWGFYGEKMQQERDHYKQAIEEISETIDDWLNSIVQEPSLDFIHAIKAWAEKKLKEI